MTEIDHTLVKIKKVFTSDNSTSTRILNPINGMDFWETPKLNKNEYIDWTVEFEEETIVNSLHFEFDYPPSKMIIYAGRNNSHLLPINIIDNSEIIEKRIHSKIILLSKMVEIDYTNLVKFIKIRFVNEINIPLSVQFLKFTAISDKTKGKFVISKLLNQNGRMNSYCLKYDEEDNKLILVECYYCIMYSYENCQFVFKGSDQIGSSFSPIGNSDENFYIRKQEKENLPLKNNNQTIEILSSFLSDEIDFSIELAEIKTNSTISSDYPVNNILNDNLDYWSSNFNKDKGCNGAEIILKLKNNLVIKTIQIDWVQAPFSLKILLCEEDGLTCVETTEENDFNNLLTKSKNIYALSKIIKIVMGFDKSRLHDYSYQCYCSIKKLTIFKNEIELKSIHKEDDEVYQNGEKLYSDNFLLTRVNNLTSEIKIEEMYKESVKEFSSLDKKQKFINFNFLNPNSAFNLKFNILKGLNNEYSSQVIKELDRIKKYETELLEYGIENNKVSHIDEQLVQVYIDKVKDLKEIKTVFKNLKELQNNLMNLWSTSMKRINSLEDNLNLFLIVNSTHFSEAFSDKFVKEAINLKNNIKNMQSLFSIFNKIEKHTDNLHFLEEGLESLRHFTKTQLNDKLDFLVTKYEDLNKSKQDELDSLIENFQILLQRIKLIKLKFKEIHINIKDICQSALLVTNSFFDNYFVKLLVSFTRENKNEYNIFIFKFLNKNVFFYLKYNGFIIEVWKKKYGIERLLYKYSNCLTEYDTHDQVENFTKLFYILIKVNNGKLNVLLRIDYTPIPDVIISHLEKMNESGYKKLVELYEQNENHLNEFYSKMTMIFEKNDVDLSLNGNIALNSPKNTTKILMVSGYPSSKEKSVDEISFSSLNTKYSYNFFQNVDDFKIVKIDQKILDGLGIDNSWKLYDTEFQVLDNFYLKFEVDLNKLFTEDKIYNLIDFKLSEGTFQDEQQSSFYFCLFSTRSPMSYFLEVVKVEKGFIFKWFAISNNTGRRINIFRKRIDVMTKALKRNITFIFVKNRESLSLQIKFKNNNLFKNVFSLKDFQFIKFLYLLNSKNIASLSSIYMSDTYGGSFIHNEKEKKEEDVTKIKTECSANSFLNYKCIVKDVSICKSLYCKSCCSKRLLKVNQFQYNYCFKKCLEEIEKK